MLWDIIKELLEEDTPLGFTKQCNDKYLCIRVKADLLTEGIIQVVFLN